MSKRLFKSTAIVGANTLLSRVFGLVRDVVIANTFGASAGVDAFLVAFRLPNFLRRLFAEGAFSQAFVPVLSEYRTQRDHNAVKGLCAAVAGMLGGVLLVVTAVGVLAAPILIYIFAPGFSTSPGKFALTVEMTRITFPYLLFISLTAFAGGVLNTYGRFAVPAFTPVLLNVSLIVAALFLAPQFTNPVTALAWGVFIAGVVQLAFQMPFIARLRLLVVPKLVLGHEGVSRIVGLMLPAMLGVSVVQINLLIDTLIASFLVSGSVTWLYYADRMVEFPLGVFGIALATVILPTLSQNHAEGSAEQFSKTIDWALRLVLIITVPAAVGLAVLSAPILTTLFQYGAFTEHDVRMTAFSLMAYSSGLVGFVGIKVLAPGFYSRQDIRTPVRIAIISMGAHLLLNLVFVVPLAHAGLALSTSLSALLNAGMLLRLLVKDAVYVPRAGWRKLLLRVAIANIIMTGALWWLGGAPLEWLEVDFWSRAWRLTFCVAGGAGVYVLALLVLGVRPRHLRAATSAE